MKTLIVDGYNIIHKVRRLVELLNKDLGAARAGLEDMLISYSAKQRSLERIYIVYDGKGELIPDTAVKGILHITYTLKGQSADEGIVGIMRGVRERKRAAVLSTDNFVTNHARASGVAILSLESFIDKAAPKKKIEKDEDSEWKVSPEQAQAINEDLKRKWGIKR